MLLKPENNPDLAVGRSDGGWRGGWQWFAVCGVRGGGKEVTRGYL